MNGFFFWVLVCMVFLLVQRPPWSASNACDILFQPHPRLCRASSRHLGGRLLGSPLRWTTADYCWKDVSWGWLFPAPPSAALQLRKLHQPDSDGGTFSSEVCTLVYGVGASSRPVPSMAHDLSPRSLVLFLYLLLPYISQFCLFFVSQSYVAVNTCWYSDYYVFIFSWILNDIPLKISIL